MTSRHDIIDIVGANYLTSNLETDEFSYMRALGERFEGIQSSYDGHEYRNLDIRFVKGNLSVLIETKEDIYKNIDRAKEQLSSYVAYEKKLTGNKVIAILAGTRREGIKVWRGVVADSELLENETVLKSIDEYMEYYTVNVNNKEEVTRNTYKLNKKMNKHGIPERLRSQFVGSCLLALKNSKVDFEMLTSTNLILNAIKDELDKLLDGDTQKDKKLELLKHNVLDNQFVKNMERNDMLDVLIDIKNNILPYINDKTTTGQDLLNLFFITFNKYVGKEDKNQAFTPDHITDLMCKAVNVNKDSRVLDPCCGSGSFLVRAMTTALEDCVSEQEQGIVKREHIYGVEIEKNAFGLATTNMLLHGDGNSNIIQSSCFDIEDWFAKARPDVILMNPPYNAKKNTVPSEFYSTWGKSANEDPSNGLYFVKYFADLMNKYEIEGKIAVLLPVSCAIGNNKEIQRIKNEMLEHNSLDAVFSLPPEMFHPGASVNACCMIFNTGASHAEAEDTFFGYFKEDGYVKKKNLGRIEKVDPETGKGLWEDIETEWLDLYMNRVSVQGKSVTHRVDGDMEWLAEAYMETDYTNLTDDVFVQTVREWVAYHIKEGIDWN